MKPNYSISQRFSAFILLTIAFLLQSCNGSNIPENTLDKVIHSNSVSKEDLLDTARDNSAISIPLGNSFSTASIDQSRDTNLDTFFIPLSSPLSTIAIGQPGASNQKTENQDIENELMLRDNKKQDMYKEKEKEGSEPATQEVASVEKSNQPENQFLFKFTHGKVITLKDGKIFDLSNIEINLKEILAKGINYGGGGPKIAARAMDAIGNGNGVMNIPYCIDGFQCSTYCGFSCVSQEDKNVDKSNITEMINQGIEEGFTYFNIPLHMNEHAVLATIVLNSGSLLARLKFYDSLSPEVHKYDEYYSHEIIEYFFSLIPTNFQAEKQNIKFIHMLSQGDGTSNGCGYYSLYAALLLKEDIGLKAVDHFEEPLLTQEDDKSIRAELAIRTLLHYGPEKVDISYLSLISQPIDGIFSKLGRAQKELIQNLKKN